MIIKCKMCGGDLRPAENATTCECEYCGSIQTIPKLDNERRLNLYDRANHFRRNNEYDKAMGIFEQILQDDRTDAEAYWSVVLCRYGIEYVEDPATKKRIPTVNRAQFTSVFADDDYKSALEYADSVQKGIYEEEAKLIDDIQKGILDISKKEKPFDVFICYKETDAEGKRTPDSVLANDLYHQLTREGFKVFFSRITLEDKLGRQYEPYIFAALNSAKVMVVLGTKPEHFSAVWVKNEWSRYLKLIKAGAEKTLVPAYKDMDPYDLPEEFSHLQAQDMGKLGFMQDLIHGIKKLAGEQKPAPAPQPVAPVILDAPMKANVQSLLGRAFMALEDGEWGRADDFCEQALNQDFQNARAYEGKLMAELKVRTESDLKYQSQPLDRSGNYQKALRFADEELKALLTEANDAVMQRIEENRTQGIYNEAMAELAAARTLSDVQKAKSILSSLEGFKDAAKGLKACDDKIESINSEAYNWANVLMKQQQYSQAASAFRALGNYRDCQTAARKCDELEKQKQAERRAKEEAERLEKERIEAENKARKDEIRRRKAEAAAAKAKKIFITLAIIAVLCVSGYFAFTKVIIPNRIYSKATALMDAGKYSDAYALYLKLTGYSDVDSIIRNDENIAAVAATHELSIAPYKVVGSYVSFGSYPQTSTGNDMTPIEWIVLDFQENKTLLISRYGLDVQPYNEYPEKTTWEKCTLRAWLNGTFMNKAFSAEEQKAILTTTVDNSAKQFTSVCGGDYRNGNDTKDKIFILSLAEANKYFEVSRKTNRKSRVQPTAYAIKQGAYTNRSYLTEDGVAAGGWWLRYTTDDQIDTPYVGIDGSYAFPMVYKVGIVVRPAFWVDLESEVFWS